MKHRIIIALCLTLLVSGIAGTVQAGDVIKSGVYVSNSPAGPVLTDFPAGTRTIYVVFPYTDMRNEPVRVVVIDRKGRRLFNQTPTFNGSGLASIQVDYPNGQPYPAGLYNTIVYYAGSRVTTILWTVAGVDAPPPSNQPPVTMEVSPNPITFTALQGAENPSAILLSIMEKCNRLLSWRAVFDTSWMRLGATSGYTPSTLPISANIAHLPGGLYQGHVTITAPPGTVNGTQTIDVSLSIVPPPDSTSVSLRANPSLVGWVASDEPTQNHFGAAEIKVGAQNSVNYLGFVQFDVSSIPSEAHLNAVALELTGGNATGLREGTWTARYVQDGRGSDWSTFGYAKIAGLTTLTTLEPVYTRSNLGAGVRNYFTLPPDQLSALQNRLGSKIATFIIEGPRTGNSLFLWKSGNAPGDEQVAPTLRLNYSLPTVPPPCPACVRNLTKGSPEHPNSVLPPRKY